MANTLSGKELLPDSVSLALCNVENGGQGWVVEAVARNAAVCPDCGIPSTARHSSYVRHLKDLPMQGIAVTIKLRVGRWRCRNSHCARKIFAERVPAVAAPHRQRTERMESIVHVVGRSLGGRPAERLMRRLGMGVSNDTTLRYLKRGAQIAYDKKLRVVGVDDWAWKKGQHYGTILVDLERRTVADLLPERSAQQVEDWFKQHPGVEIVSRDRFGLYAKAAQRGAPQAQQVADRFHLLVNLQEAVEHELSRQRRLLFFVDPSRSERTANATLPTRRLRPQPNAERAAQYQDVVAERRALQQALFEEVHRLRQAGMNASQIIRETGISRKRVDKWLRLAELPERNKMEPKMNSPAFFRDYLARRWAEGCHHVKTLLAELRTRGYTGCFSVLARFVSGWRAPKKGAVPTAEQPTATTESNRLLLGHHVSSRVAAALLLKPRPLLTAAQARKVDSLKKSCPAFALMRSLAMQFRGILRSGSVEGLIEWIAKARNCGIYSLKRFAKTLRRDWNAVQNSLKESFSNGPVEGHINRLKTLKRQM